MKNLNAIFNKLSKATLIAVISIASVTSVSCQNAARQAFHYKTDFIKQMVFQVSNDFLTNTGLTSRISAKNNVQTKATLVNYTITENAGRHSRTNDLNETAEFLTAAAFNTTAAAEEESDNTLDFLTAAAGINNVVACTEAEEDNTLEFLTNAAQINTVASEDTNNDDTLSFLTNAAQFITIAADDNSQDDTLEFLVKAAGL